MPIKSPLESPTLLRITKMLSNKTNFKLLTKAGLSLLIAAAVIAQTGCQSVLQHAETFGLHPKSSIDFAAVNPPQSKLDSGKSVEQRYNELAGLQPNQNTNSIANGNTEIRAQSPTNNGFGFPSGSRSLFGSQQQKTASNAPQAPTQPTDQRAEQNQFSPTPPTSSAASQVAARLQAKADDTNRAGFGSGSGSVSTAGYQQATQDGDKVKPVAYQYPLISLACRPASETCSTAPPSVVVASNSNSKWSLAKTCSVTPSASPSLIC